MANLVKNGYLNNPILAGPSVDTPTDWNVVAINVPQTGYQFNVGPTTIGIIPPTPFPSNISQFVFFRDNGSNINQVISFPKSGNYLLSYWATVRGGSDDKKLQTKVNITGTSVNNIINPVSAKWEQYTIPFSIKSASSQTLTFSAFQYTYNGDGIVVSGISIVSTDYTLDLYLEWIPDEYVEEQHKNIE